MKTAIRPLLASLSLVAALALPARAAEPTPGYVDFGSIAASKKGEYVEVKLDGFLFRLAAKFAKNEDPAAADLIGGLSSVRVNVVGLDDENRASTLEHVSNVRQQLADKGWEKIVTVRGKHEEDVAIFVKHRGEEAIEGLVVTVVDGRKHEAVFVNIVGNIKPDQLASLGKHLHIDHLKAGDKRPI